MKLAHFAQGLTIALLIVTAWLAWQAQQEAAMVNDRMERQAQRQSAQQDQTSPSFIPGRATPMQLMPQTPQPIALPSATGPSPTASLPPLPQAPKAPEPTPVIAAAPPPPAATTPPPSTPKLEPTAPATGSTAGSPPPSKAPTASAQMAVPGPLPLTPRQRVVQSQPALGKVMEVVSDQGFVVLNTTAEQKVEVGMTFDLRREAAVVGRITVSAVEKDATVANLDPKSVPEGVTVQNGDEVIAVVNIK